MAASVAGVSAALVYGWCSLGLLPHLRLGLRGRGCIRIAESDLDAFLTTQKRQGQPRTTAATATGRKVRLQHLKLP